MPTLGQDSTVKESKQETRLGEGGHPRVQLQQGQLAEWTLPCVSGRRGVETDRQTRRENQVEIIMPGSPLPSPKPRLQGHRAAGQTPGPAPSMQARRVSLGCQRAGALESAAGTAASACQQPLVQRPVPRALPTTSPSSSLCCPPSCCRAGGQSCLPSPGGVGARPGRSSENHRDRPWATKGQTGDLRANEAGPGWLALWPWTSWL